MVYRGDRTIRSKSRNTTPFLNQICTHHIIEQLFVRTWALLFGLFISCPTVNHCGESESHSIILCLLFNLLFCKLVDCRFQCIAYTWSFARNLWLCYFFVVVLIRICNSCQALFCNRRWPATVSSDAILTEFNAQNCSRIPQTNCTAEIEYALFVPRSRPPRY